MALVKSILMHKVQHYSLHILLIAALVFSSVGFTTISLSCPLTKQKEKTACPKCRHTMSDLAKKESCCKTTIVRSVLKTDCEKVDHKPIVFHHLVAALTVTDASSIDETTSVTTRFSRHFALLSRSSVEKCALLSTFLI